MKHSVKALLVLVIVSLAPGLTVAVEEAEEPVTAALSPETRGVLIRAGHRGRAGRDPPGAGDRRSRNGGRSGPEDP